MAARPAYRARPATASPTPASTASSSERAPLSSPPRAVGRLGTDKALPRSGCLLGNVGRESREQLRSGTGDPHRQEAGARDLHPDVVDPAERAGLGARRLCGGLHPLGLSGVEA